MAPESPADVEAPGSPPDEERAPAGEGHRVAPRRLDGPVIDEVMPLLPPDREHHGG